MYFEAILRFYIFLNHLVCNPLFRLVRFGSLGDIIKRHFALTLAKLHFYVDYAVGFFVGKHYNRLDAGAPWGEAFRGLKAPTLREFCEFISPWKQLLLNVEIKEKTQETVDLAFEILREFDLMERCVFTCFDAAIVEYMADRCGVLIQGFPKEYMENFREGPNGTYSKLFAVGISMYQVSGKPDMRLLSKELVREFEEMGIEPWAFCPDDEASIRYAVDCGARLVTCNNPLPALDYLTRNGLHPNRIESPVSPLL